MLSVSCASLVGLWRGSPVANARDEAFRRAQMREPKCALNLPIAIGRTPVSQSQIRAKRQRPSPIAATVLTASFPVVKARSRVALFSLAARIQPLYSQ
jgi:hypothetical protein